MRQLKPLLAAMFTVYLVTLLIMHANHPPSSEEHDPPFSIGQQQKIMLFPRYIERYRSFNSSAKYTDWDNIRQETEWSLKFLEPGALHQIQKLVSKAKKHLVTYGEGCCAYSKQFLCETAFGLGGLSRDHNDTCSPLGQSDLDLQFVEKHKEHFFEGRGAGLWVWKPKIILEKLKTVDEGDYVIYSDAGAHFLGNVSLLLEFMERHPEFNGVLFFSVGLPQRYFCKKDAFIKMKCDEPKCYDALQIDGSFAAFRKSAFSFNLVREWLENCEDFDLLSDGIEQITGDGEVFGFQGHRHDQAIITNIMNREGYAYDTSNAYYLSQVRQHDRNLN